MKSNLSPTASPSDALRAILARELGIPFPGETIKRNHRAEREERAEAYLEAHRELGSWEKVASKFGKSTTAVADTIRRYHSDQRRADLKHQNSLIGNTRPASMWDD